MQNDSPYQITFEWDDDDFYQDTYQTISRLPTPDVIAAKSDAALAATLETVRTIGDQMANTLAQTEEPPHVEMEFGIRLGADAGVITKDNRHAHFVIRMRWQK